MCQITFSNFLLRGPNSKYLLTLATFKKVQKQDSKVDEAAIDATIKTIKSKMAVSSEALANTNDMEKSKEYLALIKDCADCIQALKNCNQ